MSQIHDQTGPIFPIWSLIAADGMKQEDAKSEQDLDSGDSNGKSWDEMWIVDGDDTDDEPELVWIINFSLLYLKHVTLVILHTHSPP